MAHRPPLVGISVSEATTAMMWYAQHMSGVPDASLPDTGLSIDAISVRRGRRLVLTEVSFHVRPGEVVAVIGPNGAGKTSLLEAIVGMLPLAAGRVRYQGRPIERLRDRARVFAFMPDTAEPPPEVRVAVFIDEVRRWGGSGDAAEKLLQMLALAPLRTALIGELSRGERRRLMLFGALSSQRPVAVLDEPLAVFDPLQMIGILDVIRARTRTGASFLMSIHQMGDAEKVASRIVLLDAGQVIAVGSLTELRARIARPTAPLEDVFLQMLRTRMHAAS